ncbi:MAG: hypothetical protein M3144_07850 [Actinomycetota bacterium]|nr:hypothetical protein [Actinomycetota bacterium]
MPGAPTAQSEPTTPAGAPPTAEVNTAGDIPDNQVFVPFASPDHTFQVSVPEGWARTTDGAAVVFTDKFNSVRVETAQRPVAPDPESARSDEVPGIAGAPGFALQDVTPVIRKAGPAVLIHYSANSAVDPVTGKSVMDSVERYEFWRNGQEVILTLAGPQGADNVDPWRTVTDSFRWLG